MKHSVLLTMLLILGACSTSPKNPDKQDPLTDIDQLKSKLPKDVLINAKEYTATRITKLSSTPTLTNIMKEHYFINDKYLSSLAIISLNGIGAYESSTQEKWNNDLVSKGVRYKTLKLTDMPAEIIGSDSKPFNTKGWKFYAATYQQHDIWSSLLIGGNTTGKEDWESNLDPAKNNLYILIKVTDQQLEIKRVNDARGSYVIDPDYYNVKYDRI